MKFQITLGSVNELYNITPLNNPKFIYRKVSDYIYAFQKHPDSIVINHDYIPNFSEIIKTNTGVLRVEENDTTIAYSFNDSDVVFDDYKKVYIINIKVSPEYEQFENNRRTEYNILRNPLPKKSLTAEFFTGDIQGCIDVKNVLIYLTQEVFGSNYIFVSDFFTDVVKHYLTQSSNVSKAKTSSSYNEATIFNLNFDNLFNDLVTLYNVRGYIEEFKIGEIVYAKIFRIEHVSYFENERKELPYFDAVSQDYEGYLNQQQQYTIADSSVKKETFKNNFDTDYFKDISIEYDAEGTDKEYQITGFTDLSGVITDSSKFSNTGFFHLRESPLNNVSNRILPVGGYEAGQRLTTQSTNYTLRDNQFSNEYIFDRVTGLGVNQRATVLKSQATPRLENYKVNPELDIYWYSGDATGKTVVTQSNTPYVIVIDLKVRVFLADESLKTQNNLWIDCAVSNTYTFNRRIDAIDGWNSNFFIYDGKAFVSRTYFSLTKNQTEYQTLTLNTSTAQTTLIYEIVPLFFYNTGVLGNPADIMSVYAQSLEEGETIILNNPLAYTELLPEHHRHERYYFLGKIENQPYNFYSTKPTKKGESILFLDNVFDFIDTGRISTQFGFGELENAEIDTFKKELVIKGTYDKIRRYSDENELLSVFFDGARFVQIYDEIVLAETDENINEIELVIQVSPYATYQVINLTETKLIIVTSETGISRTYTVYFPFVKPTFYYSGDVEMSATPFTSQAWISSDGVVDFGVGFTRLNSPQKYVILNNPNLENVTELNLKGVAIAGEVHIVDLSMFTGLTTLKANECVFDQFILPNKTYTEISIIFSFTKFSPFLDLTANNDNIIIDIRGTLIDANEVLQQLDEKGWINGSINISTLALNAEGEAARLSLISKGWTVII